MAEHKPKNDWTGGAALVGVLLVGIGVAITYNVGPALGVVGFIVLGIAALGFMKGDS